MHLLYSVTHNVAFDKFFLNYNDLDIVFQLLSHPSIFCFLYFLLSDCILGRCQLLLHPLFFFLAVCLAHLYFSCLTTSIILFWSLVHIYQYLSRLLQAFIPIYQSTDLSINRTIFRAIYLQIILCLSIFSEIY